MSKVRLSHIISDLRRDRLQNREQLPWPFFHELSGEYKRVFVVHLQEIFQEYGEPSVDKNLAELQGNSLQVHRSLASHKVTGPWARGGGVGGPSYLPCVCVYQQEKLQSATSESNELSSDIHNRRQKLQRLEGKLQGAEEVRHESPQRPLFGDLLPLCTRSTPPLMLPHRSVAGRRLSTSACAARFPNTRLPASPSTCGPRRNSGGCSRAFTRGRRRWRWPR